ncbi:MAG: FAD:protein FMN transferase [Bryobacterales bacterium]|nr:FAD:protein FMN transferase [Bryobacterales bacterium]
MFACASGGNSEPLRLVAEEPHMGVVVRIEAYAPAGVNPARAFRAAFDRVEDLAQRLSSYRDDSELRQVERKARQSRTPVSADFARVLGHAIELARHSDGAFDPTLGRVTRLVRAGGWGAAVPGPSALEGAWKLTGWRHVELDPEAGTVFLRRSGLQLDLGGIAKGFVADETLEALQSGGISQALVSVGGDIAAGAPPPGKPGWSVAIDQIGDRGDAEIQLLLRHQAVSTSGSRERYFLLGGQICSHVVVRDDASCTDVSTAVSVVASSGLDADGLATALLALGRDRSEALLTHYPDVQVYWASRGRASARQPR